MACCVRVCARVFDRARVSAHLRVCLHQGVHVRADICVLVCAHVCLRVPGCACMCMAMHALKGETQKWHVGFFLVQDLAAAGRIPQLYVPQLLNLGACTCIRGDSEVEMVFYVWVQDLAASGWLPPSDCGAIAKFGIPAAAWTEEGSKAVQPSGPPPAAPSGGRGS
jgi:hypothetical protein